MNAVALPGPGFASKLTVTAVLLVAVLSRLNAATLPSDFTETLIASGLSNATAIAFSPDGRLFVCQQRRFENPKCVNRILCFTRRRSKSRTRTPYFKFCVSVS